MRPISFCRIQRFFTTMFFFHLVFISFAEASLEEKLQSNLAKGKIAYKLTTLEEFEGIFGAPTEKEHQEDGGALSLINAKYFQLNASMIVRFIKFSTEFGSTPFVLDGIFLNGKPADINQGKMIVLRTEKDLEKFDPVNGLQNVSLEKLDLRNHLEMIRKLSFDSRTAWPPSSRLPTGFNPDAIL